MGQPSTRAVYITRPANVIGGLKPLPSTFESSTAKTYDVKASWRWNHAAFSDLPQVPPLTARLAGKSPRHAAEPQ